MFTVCYLCLANPARPQWREDIDTDNWNLAVARCNLIRSNGRQAMVMCNGQMVY